MITRYKETFSELPTFHKFADIKSATEVFTSPECKLKLQIKNKPILAEELVNDALMPKIKPISLEIRNKAILQSNSLKRELGGNCYGKA